MDRKSGYIIETGNQAHGSYYLRRALQFLVPTSIVSLILISYFSGFDPLFFFFSDLRFHTFVFPVFAHALDRKCMFLICNGILALVSKNLNHESSDLSYAGFMKSSDDDASMDYYSVAPPDEEADIQETPKSLQRKEEHGGCMNEAGELAAILESKEEEDCGGCQDEAEETASILKCEVDDDDDDLEEILVKEEPSDLRVSTEELNKKFEEFIRRMKEDIRVEAQRFNLEATNL